MKGQRHWCIGWHQIYRQSFFTQLLVSHSHEPEMEGIILIIMIHSGSAGMEKAQTKRLDKGKVHSILTTNITATITTIRTTATFLSRATFLSSCWKLFRAHPWPYWTPMCMLDYWLGACVSTDSLALLYCGLVVQALLHYIHLLYARLAPLTYFPWRTKLTIPIFPP